MRGHLVGRTAIALCAVAVAVISLVPIGYLFLTGISLHDVRQQFRYPATAAAVWQSIGLTLAVSVLTIVLGIGCAPLIVRTTLPSRGCSPSCSRCHSPCRVPMYGCGRDTCKCGRQSI